jgi:hypothetical protein
MAVAKEDQKAAPDKQKQDGKKKQEKLPEEELSDEDLEVCAAVNRIIPIFDVSALVVGVWWLLRLLHVQYWPVHAACRVAGCTVCIWGSVDT